MSSSIRSPCQISDKQALKFSSGIPRRLCLRAGLHLWIFFFFPGLTTALTILKTVALI